MKSFITILILSLLPLFSVAQDGYNRLLNLRVGGGVSNVLHGGFGYTAPNKLLAVPHIGIGYQINYKNTYVSTGIDFIQKGDVYNYFTGFGSEMTQTNIRVNLLEIPFMIGFLRESPSSYNRYLFSFGLGFARPIGETLISTKASLNSPDGFRRNIRKEGTLLEVNAKGGVSVLFQNNNSINFLYTIGLSNLYIDNDQALSSVLTIQFAGTLKEF